MRYRDVWTAGVAATLFAAGTLGAAHAQTFHWNFANPYSPSEFQSEGAQQFADGLRQKTDGKLDIQVHHGGSLFPNPEILQAVRSGFAEMGSQLMTNLGREDPLWELDGIPFLVKSYDEAKILWEVSRPALEKKLLATGLRLLYAAPWPSQGFFFKQPVNSLADIKGLPNRAYNPSTTRLAELMGTVPTTIQITETPQAFATGMVAALNTSPTTGVVYKAWEFTTHFIHANAWLPKQMVFVREESFQQLPKEYQDLMLAQAKETEAWVWDRSEAMVDEAVATLAKNGMTVVEPEGKLAGEFHQIGETMLKEWLDKAGPEGKEVVDAFRARTAK